MTWYDPAARILHVEDSMNKSVTKVSGKFLVRNKGGAETEIVFELDKATFLAVLKRARIEGKTPFELCLKLIEEGLSLKAELSKIKPKLY
jgi:hypothetical protein